MRAAVKWISQGKGRHLGRIGVSPWLIRMLALFPDVALEGGGLLPWRPGNLYDQPVREVLALRAIRAAWSKQREAEIKKAQKTKRR